MQRQDMAGFFILFFGGLVMIFGVIPTHTGDPLPQGLNADTLPTLLCCVIVLVSGFQIVQSLLHKGVSEGTKGSVSVGMLFHLFKYFVLMLLIFPAWRYLGFIVGSVVILAALLLAAGERNPVSIIASCAVVVPLVYAAATYALSIPLPYN